MTRIELPFPPPLAACFQNIPKRGRAITPRYREWTNEAMWMVASQKPRKHEGEVSIRIGLVAPDKRHRDCDNLMKPILDLLVKALVIKDDSNRYIRRLSVEWLASGPPCTVIISDFEDAGS